MAEQLICVYFVGAFITALSVQKLKHFYRCVLLWPVFWAYLAVVVLEAAVEDIRHG
ncbi:hypothetical protein D3C77_226140 [compost metagenome]